MIPALFGALVVAATLSPREQDVIDRHVRTILAEPQYAFCHDEAYPLLPTEERWCSLHAEPNPRCRAFTKACAAPAGYLVGPRGRLSSRKVEEEGSQRGRGEGRERDVERREPDEIEVPALGGVAELLFWLIVIGAVVLIIFAIAKNLVKGRAPQATPEGPEANDVDPAEAASAAAQRAMETDVDRLLAMARDSAGKGEFADAVDFAHAALLRRLDHEGLIRLHRARTNGDYVRDLQPGSELRGPVRDVLRRVDRAQFGTQAPERTTFETIFDRVGAIVKKAGPLAALALMVALGCDPDGPAKSYPWAQSPSGTDAVIRLLEARSFAPSYRTAKLTKLDDDTLHGQLVLVMVEGATATEAEWEALDTWTQDGGRLVLAGAEAPPWLAVAAVGSAASGPVWVSEQAVASTPVPYVAVPDGLALDPPAGANVLLERGDAPYALRFDRGAGSVTVLADDYLFTNASLPVEDNAVFLDAMLRDLGQRVEFVDSWADVGADNPLQSIRHTHLTPAVIQLLLLILALYLWRGTRFGRGRDPAPPSRRAFVQHAVAMGQQYTRARATGHAAAAYAGWVLERLRDQFPIAASGGLHGLAQQVARRSGRDETAAMRLLVEAHGAAESRAGVGTPGDDLALVRDLGRLMREIGGGV